ncbi:MAG: HAMP domain-containing histidine kinase [Oscillospiraceae bacterium]|jgi:signal transduction histidine kinase|nr:HAMP domain-containing histidine kinase [Oscillospiraceae bacterium]
MFRNKEFRQFAALFLVLAAAGVTAGFILHTAAGVLVMTNAVVFGVVFFVFTRARYRSLARISQQIDLVLHNADRLALGDFDEGELAVLYSEITKMTLRIREQNEALTRDKQYLADSLTDIAHQLRTPLTSVNLVLSFLAKADDEKERQTFVREAEELLVRMDWLITSLLKLSRLDAGVVMFQREPIRVAELVQSALRPLAIPMELRGIDLQTDVPEDATIQGDRGWLSEAVQNILKNCMESAGENGKIEITCADNTLFTELVIRDSGAGFEKEDLPRLFDRFYRGKSTNTMGYGIGLALCKMIITRQDGTIAAKNHPRGGAVFAIRFPKVTDVSSESHRRVI